MNTKIIQDWRWMRKKGKKEEGKKREKENCGKEIEREKKLIELRRMN